jgi:hypothetical protein
MTQRRSMTRTTPSMYLLNIFRHSLSLPGCMILAHNDLLIFSAVRCFSAVLDGDMHINFYIYMMHNWPSLARLLYRTLFAFFCTCIILSWISRTSVKYFSHPNYKFTSESDTYHSKLGDVLA